ncbi:MAG: PH domain-containing protein [Candidatus Saccharibacteria bacterium]
MDESDKPVDYSQPVAYDTNGQPLYSHPPVAENLHNDNRPEKVVVSDADKIKHMKSEKVFPEVNLSEGDYVITSVRRHPIGILNPVAVGVFLISLAFIALFNYDIVLKIFQVTSPAVDQSAIFWTVILFTVFVMMAEYVIYYVYASNKFFLTNDSIVQQVQTSLFSNSAHIINLGNIKDTSYSQTGIMQQLLNYGVIKLSTEGDETEYKFTYVANPKEYVEIIDNAIENYKNCQRDC